MALGASSSQVLRLVLTQGLAAAFTGIGIGIAASAALTRYMKSWIFGVTPLDAATFAAAAGVMVIVAIVAIYAPVRRALRVNPIDVLRAE